MGLANAAKLISQAEKLLLATRRQQFDALAAIL